MFRRPRRAVTRVFIHCSASDHPEHANVETIRLWHLARGFADVGYHYVIGFDGSIEPGRALERIPAAQLGYNSETIAICLSGGQNGRNDAFTQQQFQSLKNLCSAIHDAYDGHISFHGHSEVSDKACPVFDYRGVLELSAQGYMKRPRINLKQSRTITGGRVASAGAAISALETGFAPQVQQLSQASIAGGTGRLNGLAEIFLNKALPGVTELAPWLALVLVLFGISLIIFARLDDHERGLR